MEGRDDATLDYLDSLVKEFDPEDGGRRCRSLNSQSWKLQLGYKIVWQGYMEHGIPFHSLCVSGLVSESDECLPRFLCFGSPTIKSKALFHCNNNPSQTSMIGK